MKKKRINSKKTVEYIWTHYKRLGNNKTDRNGRMYKDGY